MSSETRDVYMNRLQQTIYYAGARDIRLIGARRFGKTDGTIGPAVGRVTQSMPQGGGIWAGNSRKQLLTRTVPATISAIERFWGWKEGTHFWWGRPPAKLDIPSPIVKPKDWSNVISFYNGFVWHLVSLAVTGSANSLTVNFIIIDEAKFASKKKIDAEMMPALSGQVHPMADPRFSARNPYYKGTLFASDAALTQRDNWMEKEEEKCDIPIESGPFKGRTPRDLQRELDQYAGRVMFFNELMRRAKKEGHGIRVVTPQKREEIRMAVCACMERTGAFRILPVPGVSKRNVEMLVAYKVVTPEDAELLFDHEFLLTREEWAELRVLRDSRGYREHVNALRCNTFAFYRASTIDNIDIVGEDYIARMKRDLPPLVFMVSILNEKKSHASDGFYSRLDIENVHGYVPEDCPAVDRAFRTKTASRVIGGQRVETQYEAPDFTALGKENSCATDGDVAPGLPLYIAFDYNANINWVVTGQLRHDPQCNREALMVLSSMYVKYERKLRELCRDWCRYYEPHRRMCKTVTYFYDSTAKFRAYAVEGQQDFKDIVIEELTRAGCEVNPVDMGRPADHVGKYKDINESLAGVSWPFVRINRENNEALIIALENTEVKTGYRGFEKQKGGEKLTETDSDPLELRTDGTDAFDVLLLGVKYYLQDGYFFCL